MADLSIDEANKIRLSMGLPALPGGSASAAPEGPTFKSANAADDSDEEPASTIDTRQAAAHDNWLKLNAEQEAKKKREERAAAIKREREKAARTAKLEGKGLADDNDDDDDMAWLKSSKKRQKKILKAEQMQKELEERERQAREAMQYTETDLAGVRVGHEVDQFDDGEDQILVLKDTAVDAEDDDELEAVALKERERLQERLDSKKRKRAYDPNDESGQKSILAQYDEEIDGKKSNAFTLDGKGRTVEDVQAVAARAGQPKRVAISLDILQDDAPLNDYLDLSKTKMKKPKKKKSKSAKRERVEDDEEMMLLAVEDPGEHMELDATESSAPKPKKKSVFDQSFIDDDDLQANLAAQRQKALRKRKKMRPEDIARQMREEASAQPTPDSEEKTPEEGDVEGLVIDETTEFVQNLGANADDDEEEARRRRGKSSHVLEGVKIERPIDEDGDLAMDQSYAEVAEAEDAQQRSQSRAKSPEDFNTGLEAEKTVDGGMGATLALLRQRGLVAAENDASTKNALYRERQKFLADKQRAEGDAERQRKMARERERNSARWNTMTPREREEWARKQNTNADASESRRLAEIFNKEYKPNVELNYVDEHGRQMNQKEAFKQLSHQFHGKGSGNTKTKKHLDKVAQEKKKMAESSLEVTRAGGVGSAHDQQAKKLKTAGVRLQ
ncbi:SART-1 protein [Boeremia exigua]|uniref:SART-1 protein n=1 Tax=Boeremia exigua TaxID=749465 RepID=UPI001E8E06DA|nr:SART-1 protein [Boeremia exigua]KAH6618945.1 SART-1 protein [Boeremia exigua]